MNEMGDNMILPAHIIYMDEAGTPSFTENQESDQRTGYVVSAVVVPEIEYPLIHSILPRDTDGNFIKSSSREMTPETAKCFISDLLATSVDVYMVLLSTDDSGNVELARGITELSRRRRQNRHNRFAREPSIVYMLAAKDAIIGVLRMVSARLRIPISYFNLILDNANITDHDKRVYENAFREQLRFNGITCGNMEWVNSEEQTFLNIPDILAGVCLRHVTNHDVVEAWSLLEHADRIGRIIIQDGMETIDPMYELQNGELD